MTGIEASTGKRAQQKARTREALLAAAVDEFAARGYRAARVEGIAEAAGVTTGALYSHFRSKEQLFLAVYDLVTNGVVDDIAAFAGVEAVATAPAGPDTPGSAGADDPALDPGGSGGDPASSSSSSSSSSPLPPSLAGIADAWLDGHEADPRIFRLNGEFLLALPDLPLLREEVTAHRRRIRRRFGGLLEAFAESSHRRLTIDPDDFSLLVHSFAIGMVAERLGDPEAGAGGRFGTWVEDLFIRYTEEIQ